MGWHVALSDKPGEQSLLCTSCGLARQDPPHGARSQCNQRCCSERSRSLSARSSRVSTKTRRKSTHAPCGADIPGTGVRNALKRLSSQHKDSNRVRARDSRRRHRICVAQTAGTDGGPWTGPQRTQQRAHPALRTASSWAPTLRPSRLSGHSPL